MKKRPKKDPVPTTKSATNKPNNTIVTAKFKDLIDIVLHEGESHFLIKTAKGLEITKVYTANNKTFTPPTIDQIPWQLCTGEEVIKATKEWHGDEVIANQRLFNSLVNYHKQVSELPREEYYYLLAAWDIHTYRQEDTYYSPEISFFAVADRGKTRTGKGLVHAAYRGVRLASMTEATIFRLSNNYGATLFFDLSDMRGQMKAKNSFDVLLNRFEKGGKIPRVLRPDKEAFKDMDFFDPFGATVIATNTPLGNILESRCIEISMTESDKVFENEITEESALPIRTRLLAFRAHYHGFPFPVTDKLFSSRLGDILRPLHTIIAFVDPSKEEIFTKLAYVLKNESVRNKSMSKEAEVLKTIIELEGHVNQGKLAVSDIHTRFNQDKPERFHTSPNSIGNIVKSLGFYRNDRPRMSDGGAAIPWDKILLKNLAKSYGLEFMPYERTEDSDDIPKTAGTIYTGDGPINLDNLGI
ncbi:MAG: hypothetical protein WD000_00320 [Thermodesulfobacteriota bacterium]